MEHEPIMPTASHELWLRQAYEVLAARGDHTLANTCRQASVAFAILRRELVEAKERIALRDSIIPDLAAHIERLQSCERSMREALQRIGDPDFEYCSDEDEDTQLSMRMADARAVLNGIANRPSAPLRGSHE